MSIKQVLSGVARPLRVLTTAFFTLRIKKAFLRPCRGRLPAQSKYRCLPGRGVRPAIFQHGATRPWPVRYRRPLLPLRCHGVAPHTLIRCRLLPRWVERRPRNQAIMASDAPMGAGLGALPHWVGKTLFSGVPSREALARMWAPGARGREEISISSL